MLPPDIEQSLKKYVLDMDKAGFGVGKKSVQIVAVVVAKRLGLQSDFKASDGWWYNFMRRNPELSSRRAQAFERLRASGLNRDQVINHFKVVEEAIQFCITNSESGTTVLNPNLFLNLDESAVAADKDGVSVITKLGS